MRQNQKLTFWPAYFETNLTRSQGRRVSKKIALRGVKSDEIYKAATDLGLNPVIDETASYPKESWRKSGKVIVDKTDKKSEIIYKIANNLRYNRIKK